MEQIDIVRQAERIIGHTFSQPELMLRALTHSSVADDRVESNERLEFLGDAVLGMVACQRIFELYPELLEGEMTKIKSVAVSRKTCASIAREIGLEDCLVLGKGIRDQKGALPHSLAAAALESTIAALYMDAGLDVVEAWLGPLLDDYIENAYDSGHQSNYKSVLQQHVQRRFQETPEYILLDQEGPDHAKTFRVSVKIAGTLYDAGEGGSKKQAEQRAALVALHALDIVERTTEGHVKLV